MNHTEIIKSIFISCNYCSYLELGVYTGETLNSISKYSNYSIGVDVVDKRTDKSTKFFLGDTDTFFSQNTYSFDCIFIDANHDIEYVQKDFENSVTFLNKNGTIFIHDTCPESKIFLQKGYCSNSYLIHENLKDYCFVTLPANQAGLTIVRNKEDFRFKDFI